VADWTRDPNPVRFAGDGSKPSKYHACRALRFDCGEFHKRRQTALASDGQFCCRKCGVETRCLSYDRGVVVEAISFAFEPATPAGEVLRIVAMARKLSLYIAKRPVVRGPSQKRTPKTLSQVEAG